MNDFEKFPADELKTLRDELRQSGLDSFQSAELLAAFLAPAWLWRLQLTRPATQPPAWNKPAFALPHLQEELEKLAWVM